MRHDVLRIGPVSLYQRNRHLGLTTPWFLLVTLPTLAWLRPGWWAWEKVSDVWIVRALCFVLITRRRNSQ